jgi:hypothetical protein
MSWRLAAGPLLAIDLAAPARHDEGFQNIVVSRALARGVPPPDG